MAEYALELLMVDDCYEDLLLFHQRLKDDNRLSSSINLTLAHSPEKALKEFKSHDFDVVTMDYNMPTKTAFELIDEFKSVRDPIPPVIMITSINLNDFHFDAIDKGFTDFVLKDLESKYISVLIDKVMKFKKSESA